MKAIKLILIVFVIFAHSDALAVGLLDGEWFVPLTKTEIYLQGAYIGVTCIDWLQTKEFRSQGVKESNPGLGSEPSQERVDTMIGGAILAHTFIAYALPAESKKVWIIGFLVIEIIAVHHNYNKGWGLTLSIPPLRF